MYEGGSHNNSYYSNDQKRARKRVTKQQFHQSLYHMLIDSDQVQYGRYQEIADPKFQYFIRQMLKDLNFLLYLNEQEFWNHLEKQTEMELNQQPTNISLFTGAVELIKTTVRLCLQSCLSIFSRKPYLHYHQKLTKSNCCSTHNSNFINRLRQLPQFWFKVWYQIKKVVLIIFYRICCSSTDRQKLIRFEGWYIDTSKMLDICLIYGKENPDIVKKMASLVFVSLEELQDFRQSITLTLKHLERICFQLQNFKINIKELMQRINKEEINWELPMQVIIQSLSSLMFKIFDVMLNLESIYLYFPEPCQQILLEQALIFKRLIMIYCKLKENMKRNWLLGQYEKKYRTFSYLIYQRITIVLAKGMILIHQALFQKKDKQQIKKLKTTFINICHFLFFSPAVTYDDKDNKEVRQLYMEYQLGLAKSMLEVNPSKSIFANSMSIDHFNRSHKNFANLSYASFFQNNFKSTELEKLKQLKKYDNWKLPPSTQIFKKKQQKSNTEIKKQLRNEKSLNLLKNLEEYQDEPLFSNELFQNSFNYQRNLETKVLEDQQQEMEIEQKSNKTNPSQQKPIVFSQEQIDKPQDSLGQLSISTIQINQRIHLPGHSIDLYNSRSSSNVNQTNSDDTGITKTEWNSQSNYLETYSQKQDSRYNQ